MREKHTGKEESKGIYYRELEEYARAKIREHLQDLLLKHIAAQVAQDLD